MKNKRTRLLILSAILFLSLCPAAYGRESGNDPVDKTLAPYFMVEVTLRSAFPQASPLPA